MKRLLTLFICVAFVINSLSPLSILAGNQTQTHDANGNLINDGIYCYTYNDANRLSVVKTCADNKLVAEYVYNFAGERFIKKVYENGIFKYMIMTINDLYEVKINADGSEEETTYYRANGELVANKVVKRPAPSATPTSQELKYHHTDHLGSASLVTSSTGTKVEETRYLPYGSVREGGSENLTGRYTYTGQESDSETGLMYYGARYYSPVLGRFIQPDSMLPNIYDPQSLNRYSYVKNNPLKYTDPSGHEPVLGQLGSAIDIAIEMIKSNNNPDAAKETDSLARMRVHFSGETKFNNRKDTNTPLRVESQGPSRFVYTNERGWIDMRHFFTAAEYTRDYGGFLTSRILYVGELDQLKRGSVSAFSYEDMASNQAGIDFWNQYGDQISNGEITLERAVYEFLINQGAIDPKEAPNYDYITHHTTLDGSYTQLTSMNKNGLKGEELKRRSKENYEKQSAENKAKITEAHKLLK
jgi:RHS repeat-associated protein